MQQCVHINTSKRHTYTQHSCTTTTACLGSSGHWSSAMPLLISHLDRAPVSSQRHLFSFQDSLACHVVWCGVVLCKCGLLHIICQTWCPDLPPCTPDHLVSATRLLAQHDLSCSLYSADPTPETTRKAVTEIDCLSVPCCLQLSLTNRPVCPLLGAKPWSLVPTVWCGVVCGCRPRAGFYA